MSGLQEPRTRQQIAPDQVLSVSSCCFPDGPGEQSGTKCEPPKHRERLLDGSQEAGDDRMVADLQCPISRWYRGTSLMKNSASLRPYSSNMPKFLWRPKGGGDVFYDVPQEISFFFVSFE